MRKRLVEHLRPVGAERWRQPRERRFYETSEVEWEARVDAETILKVACGGVDGGLRMKAAGQLFLRCFVETSFLAQAWAELERTVEAKTWRQPKERMRILSSPHVQQPLHPRRGV